MPQPELDRLSAILRDCNDQFGNIEWKDADRTWKVITEEIPAMVSKDGAYRNAMRNSGEENARIEHDKALQRPSSSSSATTPSSSSSSTTTHRRSAGSPKRSSR